MAELTTFEQAKRCPKCDQPGDASVHRGLPGGGRVYTVMCRNEKCRWFDTGWAVQINPDGEVYDRAKDQMGGKLKTYPAMTPGQLAQGQRAIEDVVKRDLRED
jgi:hypothetical protein